MRDAAAIKRKLKENLPSWVRKEEQLLKTDSMEWLEQFDPSRVPSDVKLFGVHHEFLWDWYQCAYVASVLEGRPDASLLALACRAGITSFLSEIPVYSFFPGNLGCYGFDRFGQLLAGLVAVGWRFHSELIARLGFIEVDRLLLHGLSRGPMPWFMLALAKDWLGARVSVDRDGRRYDRASKRVWDALLSEWRNPDAAAFDTVMYASANHRLEQSRNSATRIYEFENGAYWLFPVELLAVLRLREWEGVPNPSLTHPLFSATAMGRLPESPPWPVDLVCDQAETKFRERYPDMPSLDDLPRLREAQGVGSMP